MENERFDHVARLVSRRGAMATLGAAAALALGGRAEARRRRGVSPQDGPSVCAPAWPWLDCTGRPLASGKGYTRCDLSGTVLYNGVASGANFSRATLAGANLTMSQLNGANFGQTCLSGTGLYSTSLRGANFSGADLSGSDLCAADLRGSNISPAQLATANLCCSTLLPSGKPAVACGPGETCVCDRCLPPNAAADC